MTLLDTVTCDRCGEQTSDPHHCEHFELCPRCIDGWSCSRCGRVARDETGATR